MITVTIALILFLIGVEFLFFTGRLQCDAENACKETNSWYRPISEWLKDPRHLGALRIMGGISLVLALYLLYFAE